MEINCKECTKCLQSKALDQFHRQNTGKLGRCARCKTCSAVDRKEKYRKNKEKVLKQMQEYRHSNRDKVLEQMKTYYESNKDKVRSWQKEYYDANKDKYDVYRRRRETAKIHAFVEDINTAEVFDRDNWICQICLKQVDCELVWPDPYSKSLDHIVPLSRGGEHSYRNVQLAHLRCNLSKGNRVQID